MSQRDEKTAAFEDFWAGKGAGLILVPVNGAPTYDLADYARCFRNPAAM